jgi:putative heme-binding domain-containing protein
MRSRWTAAVSVSLTAVLLAIAGLGGQPLAGAAAQAPPAASTAARSENQAGAELFATTCKVCHGESGIGGVGPALRGRKFTRAYVRRAMSEGRPNSMMPEFTKTFTAAQMNQVSSYVAALQSPDGPAPEGLHGDPAAGEATFFARGARSCYVCHSVGGRGGSVGPELSLKVAGMSPREIFQRIIVVPHRSSDPAYATTRLTTKVGTIYTGIKAGETEDAIRFYDTSVLPPLLRTIRRADIVDSEAHDRAVMPSDYASRLTLQQLLDIVSFLKSPAGGPPVSVALGDVIR